MSTTRVAPLKAPFPYFGGKSKVADLVWKRLGDVPNFIEPFAGSAAMLLRRPGTPHVETINDRNSYVANFWRATQHAPEAVAEHADGPVIEADLHARHRWLVLSTEAAEFRERMRTDPDYFDARIAGWWVWGACCWIGSGWCDTPESAEWDGKRPDMSGHGTTGNRGIHAAGPSPKMPGVKQGAISGVHASMPEGRPQLADAYARGRGVHNDNHFSQQRPHLSPWHGGKPDARGVLNDNHLEVGGGSTCDQRRAWLMDWFARLRDRLRTVRVCCGHWLRVCDSHSVTTRLGVTGLFLDPPYPTHEADGSASRSENLYGGGENRDELDRLRDEVLAYCLDRGTNPEMRIAVCGYDTDGYAVLESQGWEAVAWKATGGYGNRAGSGNVNKGRERIWFSPHCIVRPRERTLFDLLEPEPEAEPCGP